MVDWIALFAYSIRSHTAIQKAHLRGGICISCISQRIQKKFHALANFLHDFSIDVAVMHWAVNGNGLQKGVWEFLGVSQASKG